MELYIVVYLISLLTPLNTLLWLTLTFSLISIFVTVLQITDYNNNVYGVSNKEAKLKFHRLWRNFFLVLTIVLALFLTVLPDEKTAYTMAGAYAVQRVAETDQAKELGQKVFKVLNSKLDQYVDEIDKQQPSKGK